MFCKKTSWKPFHWISVNLDLSQRHPWTCEQCGLHSPRPGRRKSARRSWGHCNGLMYNLGTVYVWWDIIYSLYKMRKCLFVVSTYKITHDFSALHLIPPKKLRRWMRWKTTMQRPSQARGDTTNCDFPEVHIAQGVHDGQHHTKHHLQNVIWEVCW